MTGFWGWGRDRPMKQWVTTTVFAPARCTNQNMIYTKHRNRPKGRNDGRIASLSHRTRREYENLPLSPPLPKEPAVIQVVSETKVQNVKTGVLGFLTLVGKGVNTRIDNLRVHMASSDTRTTSVGTTALSHNIVFICGDINALGWDPRMLFWENSRLWRPNRAFRVAGVAQPWVS